MLQNFTQIASNLVVDSFTYLMFLIFLILRIGNVVVRIIEDSNGVILLGKKEKESRRQMNDYRYSKVEMRYWKLLTQGWRKKVVSVQ